MSETTQTPPRLNKPSNPPGAGRRPADGDAAAEFESSTGGGMFGSLVIVKDGAKVPAGVTLPDPNNPGPGTVTNRRYPFTSHSSLIGERGAAGAGPFSRARVRGVH